MEWNILSGLFAPKRSPEHHTVFMLAQEPDGTFTSDGAMVFNNMHEANEYMDSLAFRRERLAAKIKRYKAQAKRTRLRRVSTGR